MIKFFSISFILCCLFACNSNSGNSPVSDLTAKELPEVAEKNSLKASAKVAKVVFDSSLKPFVKDLNDRQKASFHKLASKEFCPCGKPVTLLGCIAPGNSCKKSELMADFIKKLLLADWPENMLMEDFNQVFSPEPKKAANQLAIETKFCKGPSNAKIKIHEFSDFECPHCKMAVKYLYEVKKAFPDDVQVCFMPFPLRGHQLAYLASIIAFSMPNQDSFWRFHDLVFENQEKLSKKLILELSAKSGLKLTDKQLEKIGETNAEFVNGIRSLGDKAGLQGTPSFFINGNRYEGAPSFLVTRINYLLAK